MKKINRRTRSYLIQPMTPINIAKELENYAIIRNSFGNCFFLLTTTEPTKEMIEEWGNIYQLIYISKNY